jgi:hypothetical protein
VAVCCKDDTDDADGDNVGSDGDEGDEPRAPVARLGGRVMPAARAMGDEDPISLDEDDEDESDRCGDRDDNEADEPIERGRSGCCW